MISTRFQTLLMHDMRQLHRFGILYAYATVIAMYILVLTQWGQYFPNWLPALIIYTDPAVVGFFFIGGLALLEKSENTRTALSVTPISAANYFWGKTLPLTGLALVATLVISFFLPAETNHFMLAISVVLMSAQFLGIGLFAAFRFKSVTSYLIGAAGYLVPIILPAGFAFIADMPLIAQFWPPAAQLRLILIATQAAPTPDLLSQSILWAITLLGAIAGIWFGIWATNIELGRAK